MGRYVCVDERDNALCVGVWVSGCLFVCVRVGVCMCRVWVCVGGGMLAMLHYC